MSCGRISEGTQAIGYYGINSSCARLNIFGLIPGISLISGIFRICIFANKLEYHEHSQAHKDYFLDTPVSVEDQPGSPEASAEGEPNIQVVLNDPPHVRKKKGCAKVRNYNVHIARGVIEILCLGIFILFVDLIKTIMDSRGIRIIPVARISPLSRDPTPR